MLDMRLVVYEGDTWLDVLPDPLSIQWTGPINDTPTLQFEYSNYGGVTGSDYLERLIDEQLDVAVELNWGSGWKEPPMGRFVIMDRQDDTSDQQHIYKFVGIGVDTDLDGVVVTDHSVYDNEGKRTFTNATPGQILDTYHNYGTANGMLTLLTNDFTVNHTSAQSNAEEWNNTLTWAVTKETSYRTALDTLTSYGLTNWRCEGNVLRVFNDSADGHPSDWGGMQRDLTDGSDPVEVILGRECVDGPQSISRRNLTSNVWVLSDNNADWLRTDSSAYIRRGKHTTTLSQGGITTEGGAALVGDSTLKAGESNREQLTRSLKFDGTAHFLPVRDYLPGDWIFGPGKNYGGIEKLRVAQITLMQVCDGVITASLILNDRLLERSVAMQKRIAALSGGAVVGGSGGATQPKPPGRTPAKPSGHPSVSGAAYVDASGHIRATINVTWPSVSSGADGQAIDIDHYELRIRKKVS